MNTAKKQGLIQDTKQNIIQVASQLFSEKSYLGVSMSDIAEKLNITKAALYYHFTSKEEIYVSVLEDVFHNLDDLIASALKRKTTEKKLQKLIESYLEFGIREKNLIKMLTFELTSLNPKVKQDVTAIRKKLTDRIQPLIQEIIVKKKITNRIDGQLITSLLTGMMDGLLLEYSFLNKTINIKKISKQIILVLFS